MATETIPPYIHHTTQPISQSAASDLLAHYLLQSESHPHLHPDALITPTEVTFSVHGGPMGGVVMHNLRRISAGLRGEFLEPEKTPEPEEKDEEQAQESPKKRRQPPKRPDFSTREERVEQAIQEDWQPLSEFEREEGADEEVDDGERYNFVAVVDEEPAVERDSTEGKKRKHGEEEGNDAKVDKDTRKKAKKERKKELQREKANKGKKGE